VITTTFLSPGELNPIPRIVRLEHIRSRSAGTAGVPAASRQVGWSRIRTSSLASKGDNVAGRGGGVAFPQFAVGVESQGTIRIQRLELGLARGPAKAGSP
jgi:hypothetical protein